MRAFGPYSGFNESERFYLQERRHRAWSMSGARGLHGYAAYLNGDEAPLVSPEASGVIASELAAVTGPGWLRPIFIGVATSAAAFIVNRWLARMLK